jgi:hypothetical protein
LLHASEATGASHKISEPLSQLIRQIEDRVSSEVEEAISKSRRTLSEELNQALRRLRQCHSTEDVASWLLDASASFGGPAALFEVMGTQVRGVRSRGFAPSTTGSFEELEAAIEEAPALAHSVHERETVVAIGTAAQVSTRILDTLPHASGEKVYLYPMVILEKVVAILYVTSGGRETVDSAALELLTDAAARAAQVLSSEDSAVARKMPAELVNIQGIEPRQAHVAVSPAEIRRQALDARARWFARTEIARMRLFQRKAIERGRMKRDIYSVLRSQIEAARRTYAQDFLAVSPVIADYLHRELVSLANGDANLLGPEYPGSLVESR